MLSFRLITAFLLLCGGMWTFLRPLPVRRWLYWLAVPLIVVGVMELIVVVTGDPLGNRVALFRLITGACLSAAGVFYFRAASLPQRGST